MFELVNMIIKDRSFKTNFKKLDRMKDAKQNSYGFNGFYSLRFDDSTYDIDKSFSSPVSDDSMLLILGDSISEK